MKRMEQTISRAYLTNEIGTMTLSVCYLADGVVVITIRLRDCMIYNVQSILTNPTRKEKRQAIALLLELAEMAMAREGK
jgi:hypothetical protein